MRTAYWLLRQNQELGPFTIDELLQQSLTSTDLVWVDGESHAWAYPAEIIALQSYLKTVEKTKQKRKDPIEARAEALRKEIFSYQPVQMNASPVSTVHSAPLHTEDERMQLIEFNDHSRKALPLHEYAMIVLIVVFAGMSVYGGKTLVFSRQSAAPAPVAKVVEAEVIAPPVEEKPVISLLPAMPDTVLKDSLGARPAYSAGKSHHVWQDSTKKDSARQMQTATEQKEATPVKSVETPAVKPTAEPVREEKKEEIKKETPAEKKDTLSVNTEPEKKKSLGQVLKGLFGKKKKKEE